MNAMLVGLRALTRSASARAATPTFGHRASNTLPLWTRLVAQRAYSTPPHSIISMPALSPTMDAGNIVSWSVAVGEEVTAGDVLAEIETDKATMEFEAVEDGFLAKILVEAGAKDVKVGEPICVIAESADDVPALASVTATAAAAPTSEDAPVETPQAAAPAPAPAAPAAVQVASTSAPASTQGRVKASPVAKVLAKSRGIDISTIVGTGAGGRITKEDVANAPSATASAAAPAPAAPAVRHADGHEDIELTMMRKTIAKRLTESHQTIPMFYTTMDIRMDNVLSARAALNDMADGEYKISVNDFVVKASAQALLKVPQANSSWQGSFIRQYSHADISIAVSTPAGLITPIVFDADSKGLVEISKDVKTLAALAKDNKLQPEQFMGGTFSISNMGMYGVNEFTAIVNPPQSCILAVAGTQKVLVPGATTTSPMETAHVMKVTLTADHRVVDGAVAAQWLNAFKFYMEDPRTLLLH